MRLTAQARVFLAGEDVFRQPTFWDKVQGMFGSDVDLRTGEVRVTQDVLALAEQIQRALLLAKVDNAVSLVIDNDVIFEDTEEREHDANLLVVYPPRQQQRGGAP